VHAYLRYHGWRLEAVGAVDHIFIAKRGNEVISIRCESSLTDFGPSKIRDLVKEAATRFGQSLVCITAEETSSGHQRDAARGRVLLLHYKKLGAFAGGPGDVRKQLDAMRISQLDDMLAEE
jgi:hypothetical protein